MSQPKKSFIEVAGAKMAYTESGDGAPIVLLHGNPTSSYLWRNIIPHIADLGRIIAPDLIGMGDSDKLPDSGPDRYTFSEHKAYLDGFLEKMLHEDDRVTLVVHDWGSALGFHWAHRNPDRIAGIAFMEAIVQPYNDWESFPDAATAIFQAMRSPAGEEMVLQKNVFVERILPSSILRTLNDEEQNEYRRPFLTPGEDRRPTLTWPRQIPIAGEPEGVVRLVEDYGAWLSETDLPKLFVNADPGVLIQESERKFVRSWPNLTEVTVPGIHYIQEDAPDEIGKALRSWIMGFRS